MFGRSQVKGSPDYTSFFTASIANGATQTMVRDALYLNGMVNLHKYNRTAPTMIFWTVKVASASWAFSSAALSCGGAAYASDDRLQ